MRTERSLVLAAGSLGDSLLTLPALHSLGTRSLVTLAGTSPYLALGADLFGIEKMVPLDPLLQDLVAEGPLREGLKDTLGEFSSIYLFFKEPDPTLLQKLPSIPRLQVHGPRGPFQEFLQEGRWAAEYWLEIAIEGPIQPGTSFRQARLTVPVPLQEEGKRILSSFGLSTPFILHPGSGSPAKNAPLSFFREAARKIAGEGGKDVLVLWGEAEEERTREIQETFRGIPRVRVLDRPLPLRPVAALLSLSCGYLGNDSGVTHLASACGARTFALFNSTDAKVWGPQANFIILSALKGSLA